MTSPKWQASAACIGYDPELWYPEDWDTSSKLKAKKICSGCPVRQECREFALGDPAGEWGLWGGQSARTRMNIRREQGRRIRCERADERHATIRQMAADGMSVPDIAEAMGVTKRTVHRARAA